MSDGYPPAGAVRCPLCSGEVWDNRSEKETGARKPTFPDWRCRMCKAAGWKNRDGRGWTWKPETYRTSTR